MYVHGYRQHILACTSHTQHSQLEDAVPPSNAGALADEDGPAAALWVGHLCKQDADEPAGGSRTL